MSPSPDAGGADPCAAIRESLEPLQTCFAADGYRLTIEGVCDGRLRIVVEAGENACEECLLARDIATSMIETSLPADSGVTALELVYPFERPGD